MSNHSETASNIFLYLACNIYSNCFINSGMDMCKFDHRNFNLHFHARYKFSHILATYICVTHFLA